MVQSIELVLDAGLDAAVRAQWELLRAAGLPSQARHTGPSNAPHITLGAVDELPAAADDALHDVPFGVGESIRLGGLLVFGGKRSVLARVVIPTATLLAAHAGVQQAWGGLPGWPDALVPGRWTPHVTLARRLDGEQLAAALPRLADEPRELTGTIAGARRWDSEARATWDVAGTS